MTRRLPAPASTALRTAFTLAGVLVATLGAAAPALAWGDCDRKADREASIALDGAQSIEIRARAGDLEVRSGSARSVRATGVACASKQSLLEQVQLVAERDGDTVVVEAVMPSTSGWRSAVSLDFEVVVPATVPVSITDSSGDIDVQGVTLTRLEDSSGDVLGRDLRGPLELADSSGEVRLEDVDGSVTLRDSSGDLVLRDIDGTVHVTADSSGDIEATDVTGSVIVDIDSSGDIRVSRVTGDFTVGRDSSGSVRHRDVGGRVDVPTD